MTKTMYIQPSVMVTEMQMIQTLCASGGGGSSHFSPMDPNATTDEQL
ncbi:MAG: hypothetical protein II901_00610 [Paludibacteraceae bacterium]|nr:hypothetical protein [Paludibacteraceae bacterium]MBR2165107.1 hypothetical protein [Paludibacteraceae bacterium]